MDGILDFYLASFGFGVKGRIFPPGADFQHFVVSIRPVGYATIFPYFFVYSVRQRRTGARARTVPVVQPAIMVRWVGSNRALPSATVAIWKLTGLAVEVKSCLLRT